MTSVEKAVKVGTDCQAIGDVFQRFAEHLIPLTDKIPTFALQTEGAKGDSFIIYYAGNEFRLALVFNPGESSNRGCMTLSQIPVGSTVGAKEHLSRLWLAPNGAVFVHPREDNVAKPSEGGNGLKISPTTGDDVREIFCLWLSSWAKVGK